MAGTLVVAALALGAPAALAQPAALGQDGNGPARIGPGYSDNHAGVTCIQEFLPVVMNGSPHGTYGRATYKAVKDFQASHGLEVDGAVGADTAQAMFKAGMPTSCRAALPGATTTTKPAPPAPQFPDSSTPPPEDTTGSSGAPVPIRPYGPRIPNTVRTELTGKDAHDSGCDVDAYTVKSAPMIIEQQRPFASEDSQSSQVDVGGDSVGVGSAGTQRNETTTVETTIGNIEVRYSPSCRTAWARVATEDESALSGIAITDGKHRQSRDLHPGPGKGRATKPGNYYSPMVGVEPTTRVLGSLDGNGGGGAKLARDRAPSTGWVTPATANPTN